MSIGTFCLVKNEARWMATHLTNLLPHVDEMVFFDGNSRDGTPEIILDFAMNHPQGYKLRLFHGRDPKNLQDDYVRLFDECLRSVTSDLAFFCHPDMWVTNPARLATVKTSPAVALSCRMRSFAGEPEGQLYEIKGRGEAWKNIYRLKNPDLGAHYFGHYGAANEDVYFSAITGKRHDHYGTDFASYPYEVEDSGLEILHFSDVRPYERRLDRMRKCLANQGQSVDLAEQHPRVTLKDGFGMRFEPAEWPLHMIEAREKYRRFEKELSIA